jgi:hypothetical protein
MKGNEDEGSHATKITCFVEYANAHSASIGKPKRLRAKHADLTKA